MKITRQIGYIFLLIILALTACKEKKAEDGKRSTEDSLGIEYVDSVYILDNEYTRIKSGLCDTIAFDNLNYTNANTQVYTLDTLDSTRRFLFITEVDCGFPSGNCGKSIEIIEKVNDNYTSKIKVCGVVDSIDLKTKTVVYSTFAKRKYAIAFGSKTVEPVLVSIHGMPVDDLRDISRELDILEDNLVLKGERTENMDAVAVTFTREKINKNDELLLYKFEYQGSEYSYAFYHQNGKCKQKIGGKGFIQLLHLGSNAIQLNVKDESDNKTWIYNDAKKIFSVKS
ncbi:MAG: hypothetical protein KL787_03045 [Taibaiella sp.]|nr:hypothetical protein [Taibaiella sp.]